MQKPINVRVHYPEDPKILDELETRKARSFVRALVSEYKLPPDQIDELIKVIKKEQTAAS
ncbi:hypothetical protein ACJDU8_22595 [Clostridium sp. WILCCON 0269]|uniref:Uncharacterized protein n=1 Tax=Candidatus Clostridium eludens TaxID=3381663 RepID=A0ABW8SQX3_9CLOT